MIRASRVQTQALPRSNFDMGCSPMQAPHHPLPLPKPTNLLSPISSPCGSLHRSEKCPIRGPIEGKARAAPGRPYLFGMAITRQGRQVDDVFRWQKDRSAGWHFPSAKKEKLVP